MTDFDFTYIQNWSDEDLIYELQNISKSWLDYERSNVYHWSAYYSAMEEEADRRGLEIE